MDEDMAKLFGFIKISSYRCKTIKALQKGDKNPTQIGKEVDIRTVHISKVLKEFKERGIAECINEDKRKNRIYTLTTLGWELSTYLDD